MLMSVLFSSAAPAGRNANGSMVVHTDDAVNFSAGWDYCANNPLPSTCMEFTTWTYKPVEEQEAVIWVVAAFMRQTSPAVTAYQFGVYHNLPSGYFTAWGPCGSGVLEIPDATWPDKSGTGTACAYGQPTYSYLFQWQCETMGGQYQGDGTQCAPNPCHPTPVEKTTWGRIKAGYR